MLVLISAELMASEGIVVALDEGLYNDKDLGRTARHVFGVSGGGRGFHRCAGDRI